MSWCQDLREEADEKFNKPQGLLASQLKLPEAAAARANGKESRGPLKDQTKALCSTKHRTMSVAWIPP